MGRRLFLSIMIISAMTAGCGDKKDDQTGKQGGDGGKPPVTLTVGHVGHDHQIALGIAALQPEKTKAACGAFLKELKPKEVYDLVSGDKTLARLKIAKVKGGSGMPAAMEGGQIQIGLGGVAAVAKFVDKGQPFKIVAPLHTDGDFLVVKKDSPATDWASFVAELKKRDKPMKVGYKAPVAVAKLIFVRALTAEGIKWSEGEATEGVKVVMVNVHGGKNIIPTFKSGGTEAFVMNQPVPSVAKVKELGKIIADLKMLPPKGRWAKHPCCCVAATDKVIKDNRAVLKCLIKVLVAATDLINADKASAVKDAAKWTKQDEKVETDSIPGINYLAEPTAEYMKGIEVWATLMAEEKQFTGALKDLEAAKVVEQICDMSICSEVIGEKQK